MQKWQKFLIYSLAVISISAVLSLFYAERSMAEEKQKEKKEQFKEVPTNIPDVSILIDEYTQCEYIRDLKTMNLIPRIDEAGDHICEKSKQERLDD